MQSMQMRLMRIFLLAKYTTISQNEPNFSNTESKIIR